LRCEKVLLHTVNLTNSGKLNRHRNNISRCIVSAQFDLERLAFLGIDLLLRELQDTIADSTAPFLLIPLPAAGELAVLLARAAFLVAVVKCLVGSSS
jgi:hypothetical protein